tara:strand:- start:5020 stop:5202 length:183 start_codon:yes stop_codon:yes gene_type:complete
MPSKEVATCSAHQVQKSEKACASVNSLKNPSIVEKGKGRIKSKKKIKVNLKLTFWMGDQA